MNYIEIKLACQGSTIYLSEAHMNGEKEKKRKVVHIYWIGSQQ
jgi:hypothetical protein